MKPLLALVLAILALSARGEGGTFVKGSAVQAATYGALAYDEKTQTWAYALKVADKSRAVGIVAKLCGPACEIYGPFAQCAAVAANGTSIGYAARTDGLSAEADARSNCGGNCKIAVAGCNQTARGEEFGYRRDTRHAVNFGAIAYDASTGAYGTAWDQPEFADAVAVTKGNCGKECRILVAQAGDCGVLTQGDGVIAVGKGIDYRTAEETALAKCGGKPCKVLSRFCNSKPK